MYNKGSQDRKQVGAQSSSFESLDKFIMAIRGKGRPEDLKKSTNFRHNTRIHTQVSNGPHCNSESLLVINNKRNNAPARYIPKEFLDKIN